MSFYNRIRRMTVSLVLILVVLRNGLVDAAFRLYNKGGVTCDVEEVAAAGHSALFNDLMHVMNQYSIEIEGVDDDVMNEIARFFWLVPKPNDMESATGWALNIYPDRLAKGCALVVAAERYQIHMITKAIASMKRKWEQIVPMMNLLHPPAYWNVVKRVPGLDHLRQLADTDVDKNHVVDQIEELFFQNGGDAAVINEANWGGDKLLPWASHHGQTRVVELLVSIPGINVDVRGSDNVTALRRAWLGDFYWVVEALIQAGANRTLAGMPLEDDSDVDTDECD